MSKVAESTDTPLQVLEQLIGDLELAIRIAVEYNPNCPPELVELVKGQHEVASNWDTDTQQLDSLSNSNWDWIRLAVAQNPSSSEETLLKLAEDKVFKIQLAVAKNPITSAGVLTILAQHSSKEIQAEVAKHPNATEEILHSLFDTQQGIIKSRQNLPASILERLFNESSKDKEIPLFLSASGASIYFFTKQPNTPIWILAEFANIDLEKLRTYAEQEYPKSPIANQVKGWIDDRCGGLIELTKHPQVSVEILEQLAKFPNQRVQLAVAQNSKTSQLLRKELLRQLITNTKDYIKIQIASDPQTPIEILEQLSGVSSSVDGMFEILGAIVPDITANLTNEIKAFIDRHQSPELILFWLQQGKEFQASILEDWDKLLASLNDEEKKTLEFIASQESTEEWQGKFTVQRKTASRSHRQSEPEKILLERLMYLLNTSYNSDVSNQDIIAALLGNPSTPANIREQLWQEHQQEPDNMGRYSNDAKFRISLAYNTAIPEAERMKYFKQLLSYGDREYLAKNPQTPTFVLEQLAENNSRKYTVAENPSASINLLRKLAREDNPELLRRIANNPSAPIDLLISLANRPVEKTINNVKSIRDRVLNNPGLPFLERYKILLNREAEKEIEKSNQILAKRTDSPYALARVLETGNRQVKISAARNSKTPIQVLEKLAKDEDEIIRSVVIENSSLPLETLLQLAEDTDVNIRGGLARNRLHRPTPVPILEKLAQDESERVRAEVAGNKDTPVGVLRRLAYDSSTEVCRRLTKNQNTPVEVLEFLGVEKGIVNVYNANTPETALAAAVEETLQGNFRGRDKTLDNLLNSSKMPSYILEQLATYPTSWIRSSVAHHCNTPTSALEKMIDDDYSPVLWGISRNPNATPEILERLVNRPHLSEQDIQQIYPSIAGRSDISANLVEKLLESNLYRVKESVVSQPNLPLEIAEKLITEESKESVLVALARNSILTTELLTEFIKHPNVNVCQTLIHYHNLTLEHCQQLATHPEAKVRKAVATKANAPVNVLETLAQDTETDIRIAVAENNNTPSQTLERLSQDTETTVRTKVAANPNTPSNILETLAEDESVEVRRAVANNSHTPESIRNSLKDLLPVSKNDTQNFSPTLRGLSRIYNSNTDDLPTVLSEYVDSDVAFVRFIALLHPLTSIEILEAGANSISWIERYAVADNPSTLTETKQQLAQDSNQIVRAVARDKLTV